MRVVNAMTKRQKPEQRKTKSRLAIFVQRYEQGKWLVERLRNGENVELREIKAALGEEVVSDFKSRWQGQKTVDEYERDKPEQIKRYEKLLRKADMLFGRAEKLSATADQRKAEGKAVKKAGIERMYRSAEQQYERALEQLAADYSRDKTLNDYFDRELDFDAGGALGADRDRVPRYKWSRSSGRAVAESHGNYAAENTENESAFASNKAQTKCAAIEYELERLGKTYKALEDVLAAIDKA